MCAQGDACARSAAGRGGVLQVRPAAALLASEHSDTAALAALACPSRLLALLLPGIQIVHTCLPQVHYLDPRPETVFESGELGAEAVTGMWALASGPAEPQHSLVVMSFVGGTRALQLEGGGASRLAFAKCSRLGWRVWACAALWGVTAMLL